VSSRAGNTGVAVKLDFTFRNTATHGAIGALIGVVVLHPVNSMVMWFGRSELVSDAPGIWRFVLESFSKAFTVGMLPMTVIFAVIGAAIGIGFGLYDARVYAHRRSLGFVKRELARNPATVIALGEGENTEFKLSLRWDYEQNRTNRALGATVAKTVSGFMNHRGGNLFVGVADDAEIVGLQKDYMTLRDRNRDGFERSLVDVVKTRLGGDKCSLVHCVFYEIDGEDICRVIVEPSPEAVYCQDGEVPKYYLRTGNGTRELNVREALDHVAARHA